MTPLEIAGLFANVIAWSMGLRCIVALGIAASVWARRGLSER